jgi:hypothetical protein
MSDSPFQPPLKLGQMVSLFLDTNLTLRLKCGSHRERLGYIGDAHTSLETELQNFNTAPFLSKWTQDIADIQGYPAHSGCGYGQCKLPNGLGDPIGYIPHTAPTIDGGGGPGWSGFICVMPWQLYLATGDIRPLARAFPHQQKLLKFWGRARSVSDGLIHDWSTKDRWVKVFVSFCNSLSSDGPQLHDILTLSIVAGISGRLDITARIGVVDHS